MESPAARVAFVFAGGDPPEPDTLSNLPEPELVVAADSGLHHASSLGYRVHLVVGDLDSADPAEVAAAAADGALVERHPTDKDATDLELALTAARNRGCNHVVVVGGAGGRIDHFLANALVLASPELADVHVEARIGDAAFYVVRDAVELRGDPGDLVSLLPLGGPARGVTTEQLRYPLRSETLLPGSTRGVSNELLASTAHVSLTDGVLLAVLLDSGKASS